MFKHKSIDAITTQRLLAIRTNLWRKRNTTGQLSTGDSITFLYVTQTLDRRAAEKDPWLV